MKFLADTNVFSELEKGSNANPKVQQWSNSVDSADVAMSVITLKEMETGILMIARRDPHRSLSLRAYLDHLLLPRIGDRILPVDSEIAIRCAALSVPNPRPLADALIAATALVHDLTMVTRNVGHFRSMGVRLLSPWDA